MEKTDKQKQQILKDLWYKRNPCHDKDQNGVDRFWGTVLCVFEDYRKALTIPVVINFKFLLADGSEKLIKELKTNMQPPIINQYVHLDRRYQVTSVHHDYINNCVKIYCF